MDAEVTGAPSRRHTVEAPLPPQRRDDDAPVNLMFAAPADGEPRLVLSEYTFSAGVALSPSSASGRTQAGTESALLLDLGDEEPLLVAGATVGRLPRGEGGTDLLERAVAGAEAWRKERARDRRRLRLAEQLIRFTELLNSARERGDVHDALLAHVVSIVGAYTALLCVEDGPEATLQVVGGMRCPPFAQGMRVAWRPEFAQAGITGAKDDRRPNGGMLAELSPVFVQTGASTVIHIPAWERAVLFLVERRRDRIFETSDWALLHTLVRQAAVTIERVRLFEEVSALSLTDPLTGLGNRRQMEVVLKHGIAAAQRGGLLSLVMLDLDNFKEINDREGHPAGDQALKLVADTLREHLRGSDVAVRYGGDEFLLVLPGTSAEGAESTVARIRERLAARVALSAGVVEYDPSLRSADDFIAATDREMYRDKHNRRSS